jgi:hypothetical protein
MLALAGLLAASPGLAADRAAVQAVADTRLALRQQGFKTDLAEFNLSTSPELQARAAILTNTVQARSAGIFPGHPNLLQPVGNDSALVLWSLDALSREGGSGANGSDRLTWADFRYHVNLHQAVYDPACTALQSGSIRFSVDANRGSGLRLPHLAVVKDLAQTMGDRTLLALHDGHPAAAWTNLMAATRLVTAYQPEPVEISHLVRFACAVLAYNTAWEALQTNGWSQEQLARLQQEWESVDYFTSLPETAAFSRACGMADCERERSGEDDPQPTYLEFVKESIQFPTALWSELDNRWAAARRRERGNFDAEQALMLFYRDREVELRQAVKAPTWAAMEQLPGVTNLIPFRFPSQSRVAATMNIRAMGVAAQLRGPVFLSRAAEAEALRRVLITAIALERYRGGHGAYPKTLTDLTPVFLKTPRLDFMNGQPLHYRLSADGHFLLYSVGLDCVDNGGKLRRSGQIVGLERRRSPNALPREYDLVWPLPATAATLGHE